MIILKPVSKPCDGCTKCCEGWLSGEAYGYKFGPNQKCKFLKDGCSIYSLRPADPCKSFVCAWKINPEFPDWLKPDLSNVIIVKRSIDNFRYYTIIPTKEFDKKIYKWATDLSKKDITINNFVFFDAETTIITNNSKFLEIAKKKFK